MSLTEEVKELKDLIDGDIHDVEDIIQLKNEKLSQDIKQLYKIITQRIDKLNIRAAILQFKYNDYKKYYDGTHIGIICISTFLTILESIKNILDVEPTDGSLYDFFAIFPISLSSLIALSASILKFKNYQHKMESLMKCLEDCFANIYQLKCMMDQIELCTEEEKFNELKERYMSELDPSYLKCLKKMNMILLFKELIQHMETFQQLKLHYQQSIANYHYEQKKIGMKRDFKEKEIKLDIELEKKIYQMKKRKCWLCWMCCKNCICYETALNDVSDRSNMTTPRKILENKI